MLTIKEYAIETLNDPFGIIEGDRYELRLYTEVPEDDELYQEKGIHIKVLYGISDNNSKVIKYDIIENETNRVLEFELDEDEEKYIAEFCASHLEQGKE